MKAFDTDEQDQLPRHVAIIMDGNGRWAKRRGLSRRVGHEQGARTLEDIILYASELKIKYVTLYAFSSENWQRPLEEVDAIMNILECYLMKDSDELIRKNIRIQVIGDRDRLPANLKQALAEVIRKTCHCEALVITLALSYGSWDELVRAVKNIALTIKNGHLDSTAIDEKLIRKHLYTDFLPDPDLFIRTGGEMRLSNFLLLQISYSELYFSKTLWPDFGRPDFDRAIQSYKTRNRRYGMILEI